MSQSAFWNAGNGSPDAVAFSVDRFGVVIAGICVYGGTGTYEFEAEFLEEMMCGEVRTSSSKIVILSITFAQYSDSSLYSLDIIYNVILLYPQNSCFEFTVFYT